MRPPSAGRVSPPGLRYKCYFNKHKERTFVTTSPGLANMCVRVSGPPHEKLVPTAHNTRELVWTEIYWEDFSAAKKPIVSLSHLSDRRPVTSPCGLWSRHEKRVVMSLYNETRGDGAECCQETCRVSSPGGWPLNSFGHHTLGYFERDLSRLDICQALLTFLDELKNILKFPHRYKYLHIYTNSHIYTLKCDPKVDSVKRI